MEEVRKEEEEEVEVEKEEEEEEEEEEMRIKSVNVSSSLPFSSFPSLFSFFRYPFSSFFSML